MKAAVAGQEFVCCDLPSLQSVGVNPRAEFGCFINPEVAGSQLFLSHKLFMKLQGDQRSTALACAQNL